MAEFVIHNEYGETVHVQKPDLPSGVGLADPSTPQQAAENFLLAERELMGLGGSTVHGVPADPGLAAGGEPPEVVVTGEREVASAKVVVYRQYLQGLEIFGATMGVQLQPDDLTVLAVQSSMHGQVVVENPGARSADAVERTLDGEGLRALLGIDLPELGGGRVPRQVVYRYEPDEREPDRSGEGCFRDGTPAVPPLPPTTLDGLAKGRHYIVDEVLFDAALSDGQPVVHWRALVEPESGDVLYLRPLVAAATGLVFDRDPQTQSGAAVSAASTDAVLNAFRTSHSLAGIPGGAGQPLTGTFVRVQDVQAPVHVPPTGAGAASAFSFNVRSDDFGAVNAYHNCDRLFRTMQDFGFNVAGYFGSTTFPVPVDHRALNDDINAQAPGNATGTGLGRLLFGKMVAGSPVSIATDNRVVWHEFGHGLLWDNVNSPNFGFAHSAGDALAAILNDPESAAPDRFQTFPWTQAGLPGLDRRHDRAVGAGWAWFGPNWNTQYGGEQVLSTTLFRVYRSLGGDSSQPAVRRRAARTTAYLIFKSIGLLTSTTPFPEVYVGHLQTADLTTPSFEGIAGGALHKVVRWAFEQQGLFQPGAAPGQGQTVNTVGRPPAVDVFIDDGRNGGYQYQPNHWSCQDIWVRRSADGGMTHQEPVMGQPNYLYVRVKNRGTQTATEVRVDAYHTNPGTGLLFPDNWSAMTTATLPASGPIPSGGSTIVGPFDFEPTQVGHECLLAIAHAAGDPGNDTTITGTIPEHRLVPFDNNIAQRNVHPVLPDLRRLLKFFREHRIWIRNPFKEVATVRIEVELPKFLQKAGWQMVLPDVKEKFELPGRGEREVLLTLEPGEPVSPEVMKRYVSRGDNRIELRTYLDDELSGGMSYQLSYRAQSDDPKEPREKQLSSLEELPAYIAEQVPGVADKKIRLVRLEIEFEDDVPES